MNIRSLMDRAGGFGSLAKGLVFPGRTVLWTIFFIAVCFFAFQPFFVKLMVYAASSPWTQTNWQGGAGQISWSDTTKFLSLAGVDVSSGNAVSLSATDNWYSSDWGYRKKITVDHNKVTGDLTDYPLLINFSSDSDLQVNAKSDGNDILFTAADGKTLLNFEIEKYDSSDGGLQAYVKIASFSSTVDTEIYMYYGNADQAASLQDKANTWDSNFIAVYHFNESSGNHVNATGATSLDAITANLQQQGADIGVTDGGDEFQVNSETPSLSSQVYVNDNSSLEPAGDLTIEAWVRPDADDRVQNIVAKGHSVDPWYSYSLTFVDNSYPVFCFRRRNEAENIIQRCSNDSLTVGAWNYIAGVKSGSSALTYKNGVNDSGYTDGDGSGNLFNSDGVLNIGFNYGYTFDGYMDEVRLSSIARSANYFSTTYNNINSPSTFTSLDSEETLTLTGSLTSSIFDTENASDWGTISYTATAPTGSSVAVKIRTGNAPSLSDATAFSSCEAVTSGQDISTNSCVSDGDRYAQYQVLLTTDHSVTAAFSNFSLVFAASGIPDATGFVQRVGTNLYLNGSSFRFSGPNIYWLGLDENERGIPTHFRIDNAIQTVKEMGANAIRTYIPSSNCENCIVTSLGEYNDNAFETLDYSLKVAADNDIKLILSLIATSENYLGCKNDFTNWRGVENDEFYTDSVVITDFKEYVSHVLNHVNTHTGVAYKDDPTILAWETGSELAVSAGAWPSAWTNDIASYIKSIDSNHLVSDGHTSAPYGWASLDEASLSYDSVDMYAMHSYPLYNDQLTSDLTLVNSYNKAFWIGEYDWASYHELPGDSLSSFLSAIKNNTLVGDTYWSFFGHADTYGFVPHNDGYTLHYPGDNASMSTRAQQLRAHAYAMRGLDVPSHMVPIGPLLHSITTDVSGNSISWRGVPGAASYNIDRADEDSTWATIKTGITDNDLPYLDTTATYEKKYAYRVAGLNLSSVAGSYSNIEYSNGAFTVPTPSPSSVNYSSASYSSPSAPVCSAAPPGAKAPWLYGAIAQGKNSILLYFTEADDPVDKYVLEYATTPGNYQYGVQDMGVNNRGQMTFLVQALSPNTTYFFRVRAGNGCATGSWSNEISAKTDQASFFANLNKLRIVKSELMPDSVVPATDVESETEENQSGYGLKIKVVDISNKPIEGAKVTIHSKVQESLTDQNGVASFKNVEAGEHKVLIAYSSYKGEQTINLAGDVKEFSLNIQVTESNAFRNPKIILVVGLMAAAIFILLVLLIRLKKSKTLT